MRGYIAFLKKEWLEGIRSYKIYIMVIVFFLFGMMSPVLAKITPELLKSMDMGDVQIILPEATLLDAYTQFFKNMSQMGILVLLFIFGGMLSNELRRGTLVNLVTKGLARKTIIMAKFSMAVLVWSISYLVAILSNYGYSVYLFGTEKLPNMSLALVSFWIFGILIVSFILLSSVLVPGEYGGLILTAIFIIGMFLLDIVPVIKEWNPLMLAKDNVGLLKEVVTVGTMYKGIGVAGGAIVVSVVAALQLFDSAQI